MYIDEYEEHFGYMTEADAVIEEAKTKLLNLLSDEVKQKLESTLKEAERYEELHEKCRREELRLGRIKDEILKEEKRLETSNLYDIPRKYIERFVKNVCGDFTLGDEVYTFGYNRKDETCPMCKGNKKIEAIIDGEKSEINCPKCNGRGFATVDKPIIEKSTVTNVYLRLCFERDRVEYWSRDTIFLDNKNYATDVKNIFKTYEEAEKALEERNKKNG